LEGKALEVTAPKGFPRKSGLTQQEAHPGKDSAAETPVVVAFLIPVVAIDGSHQFNTCVCRLGKLVLHPLVLIKRLSLQTMSRRRQRPVFDNHPKANAPRSTRPMRGYIPGWGIRRSLDKKATRDFMWISANTHNLSMCHASIWS
jgi:hypothetical protein